MRINRHDARNAGRWRRLASLPTIALQPPVEAMRRHAAKPVVTPAALRNFAIASNCRARGNASMRGVPASC